MDWGKKEWRRSSRSGGDNGSNCVEVAWSGSAVTGIRDSKSPDTGMLVVPAEQFALLRQLVAA